MLKPVLHPVIRSAFNLKKGLLTLVCWFSLFISANAQVTPVLNLNSTGNASLNLASLNLNDCFTSTPYTPTAAVGDGHAMWLSNNPFPSSTTDFVFSAGASFIENADGTATLKGTLTNTGNPLDQWEVNLYLSSKSNWAQWSGLGRTYKDESGLIGNNYTNWSYYIENPNLTSTIVGLSGNSGKTVEITHMPANYNFGFQVGTAANNKNSGFGLSGWFSYSLDGQNYHQGDFNLDLAQVQRVVNHTASQTTFDCSNLGLNTITITSTDQFGETCTQQVDINIKDVTPPVVVTKNVIRTLMNGTVTISANDVLDFNCSTGGISSLYGPNSLNADGTIESIVAPNEGGEDFFFAKPCTSDNCSIASYVISKKTFDCSNIGENIVTATVTDQSGNVTTATAIVYIRDNTFPVAKAKNITVALDANGIATITPQMINNGSSDACGTISLSLNKTTFDCSNLGFNEVTLIVTDNSGNTKTATANVNVVDNTAPTVVTKNISLNLDEFGQASIADALDLLVLCDDAVIDIDNGGFGDGGFGDGGFGGGFVPGAGETARFIPAQYYQEATCTKDNCSITEVSVDITDFDCSNIGQNIVTVTVSDASGNSTSKTAIVTINDITPPTVNTKNITVNLDANGNAAITPAQIDNGSSDVCGVTLSLDKTSFGCSDVGTQTVILTATDASGNTTSKTATVTIADNTAPTIITKNITLPLDANGNVSLTAAQVDNGSYDNCGITLSIDKLSFDCNQVGTQTVTLTGTDPSGNSASAPATVTIVDNTAPTIITQNVMVTLDANGNASITSNQVDNGITDNCGIATIELSKVNFDCSNLGDNTVTVTATDTNGNVSTKSVTITVTDNTAPTIITKNISVTLDANGNASITAAQVDNGSFDNCDITLSIDKLAFDCSDEGAQTVTLTGTDASGNSASASATVTVINNNAPEVVTNNITVSLDASGNASISASDLIDNAVEICTVVPYDGYSNHAVSFKNYYPNDNNWIDFKFDANGGQLVQYADGTAMVIGTIVNKSDPNDIWVAQLNLDQKRNWTEWSALGRSWKGDANIVGNNYKDWSYYQMSTTIPSTFTGGGNNTGQVKTITHMPGNYNYGFQVGQAANDKNGNYGMSGWFFYTNGQGQSVGGDFNMDISSCTVSTGTGSCDPESIEINKADFDCNDLGENTVTLTVTDSHGNTTTKTSVVTIVDDITPTVLAKDITVALDANGNANITAAQIDNGSSDNCNLTLTVDKTSFSCNDIGTQTVTLTGTDASGNTASATAIVTIVDNTAPVITVNNSITVEVDENGNATITQSQVVTSVGDDNCGSVNITISKTSFDCTDLGTNTITVTATDASGNVTTETVTVTVVDSSAPVFTNPTSGSVISQNPTAPAMDFNVFVRNNVSFKNNETEGAVALGGDLSIDGSYQVSTNSKGSFKVGNVPVTLVVGGKVNYNSGNSLQVNQNGYVKIGNANGSKVWYQDQNGANSPIRITKDNNYNSSPRLHLQANAQQLGVSASNNPIFQSNVIDFEAAFAQMEASALSMSQLANNANLTNSNGQPISNTNLPNQVKINLQDGLNVLNVTGSDLNNVSVFTFNNQPSQSKILIINVDNPGTFNWNVYNTGGIGEHVSPYILYNFYNSTTVKIQGNGSIIGTVFAPFAFINKTSHNNISGQVIGKSFTQLSGENHMFGFSGTITSGTTTEIEEGSTVVRNSDDCTYEVQGSEFTPAVTDNGCADVTLTYALTGATTGSGTDLSGVSLNVGQTVITWTATDGSNTTTFSITVDVEDNTAPTVLAKDITVALDANGNANITAAQVDNGSSDNCSLTLSIDKTSFDCTKVGAQTVTLTGTDASGNTASATAIVTIVDNTAPNVITQNISVSLNASGNAIISATQINNGSSDNCGIASMTLSKTSFNCSNIGDNTVTLTVTDNNGNTSTKTATVTIVDDIAPTVLAKNITVALDANGNANITAAQVDNGSSDNCSLTLSIDKTSFDCSKVGAQTVTLTGTDASGNTASATATVTIVDNTAPTVITQNISVSLNASGNAIISATQINNGSSDNCGIASMTLSKTSFDCSNIGDNTVTLTVTDNNGNTSTKTATVTIADNIAPTVITKNVTVALNSNGNANITIGQINNGSFDNCNLTLSVDKTSFNCNDLGTQTVTLTGTDASGNTASATATVTVIDNIAPVFTSAPSNKTYQAENGNCNLQAYWTVPVVSDNCNVTLTSTHNPGDVFPVGTTPVTYTATDAGGNTTTTSFNVTVQASPMNVVLQADTYTTASGIYNTTCSGAEDGKVMLAVTGGCGPYTYLWSNGSTSKDLNGVKAGTYSVTVTDNNGTQIQKNITLTSPTAIEVEKVVTTEQTLTGYGDANTIYLGFGEQTAVLQANATGGSGDYTYTWSPNEEIACSFENTVTVAPQVTTTYTVVVTDSNGCSTTESFTINVIDVRCDDYNAPGGSNGGGNDDDDDDDNNGGGDNGEVFDCQCEGKMKNFTVVYNGFSGVTIKAYKKDKKTVIKTFNNVQNGDEIQVTGFDHKGRLDSKTYLEIGSAQYEIHTSCSINIMGETYGPFTVIEFTDGEGATCSGNGTPSTANFTGSVAPIVSHSGGYTYGDDDDDDNYSDDDDDDNHTHNSTCGHDDDDDNGSTPGSDCQCEGRMENFTVVYQGQSGKTVKAYNKKMDYLIETYYNVQYGDTLVVEGFDKHDRLESKTMLMVDWTSYEVHTSCSINILGDEIGPFKVVAYTDGEGFSCSLPTEGGDNGGGGNNGGCDVDTINWTGNVTICYNGQTYCVTQEEAKNYLALGASLGSCSFNITASSKGIATKATGENTDINTEIKFEVSTYPNPASDLANITFNVNQDGPVTVAIFDTKGLQVGNTLFEENAEVDRKYTVVFDASSVKEGIYIIRLRTAGYIESKKLLIKK